MELYCGQGGRPGTTRTRRCLPCLLPPTFPATRNHGRRSSIGHRALPSTLRRSFSSRSHACVTLNCVRIFQCLGRPQASRRHFFLRPSPLAPCLHARCCRGDHIVQAHAPRRSPSCSSAPPVDINRQLRSIYILHTAPTSLRSVPLALNVCAWCCATGEFGLPGATHRSPSDLCSPAVGIRRSHGGIWHLQRDWSRWSPSLPPLPLARSVRALSSGVGPLVLPEISRGSFSFISRHAIDVCTCRCHTRAVTPWGAVQCLCSGLSHTVNLLPPPVTFEMLLVSKCSRSTWTVLVGEGAWPALQA
jgi:hypothetical protein